jgi:hypothetical protein
LWGRKRWVEVEGWFSAEVVIERSYTIRYAHMLTTYFQVHLLSAPHRSLDVESLREYSMAAASPTLGAQVASITYEGYQAGSSRNRPLRNL